MVNWISARSLLAIASIYEFPVLRNWEYRGIGIVDVAWKLCAAVVNFCLKRSVELHDSLHGFREGRGTGAANLEAKLAQHLAGLAHKPLFQVFLDVHKAYKSLDRGRCLELLRGYGLGPNLDRLLTKYWYQQRILPKSGKFLGTDFRTGRGVMQGDPVFPLILNIVVDAVVRAVIGVV